MAVQYYGKAAVLDAYESRGIDTWAIFQGKNLTCAGNDRDLLEQVLERLEGGSAQYTLAVYSQIDNTALLTNRTENNGAFNFKLDKEARAVGGVIRAAGAMSGDPIQQEIYSLIAGEVRETLRKKLAGSKEEGPKEETLMDILKETIKTNPAIIVQTIGAIKNLFITGSVDALAPVAMGFIEPKLPAMNTKKSEATLHSAEGVDVNEERWEAILTRLENADPDILIHLEKLASLVEKDPAKYKMALSFL